MLYNVVNFCYLILTSMIAENSGVLFHFYLIFLQNFMLANSVDPDQMSDLGLHCLPMSQNWDARHEWVKLSHVTRKSVFGVCDQVRLKPACSADDTT